MRNHRPIGSRRFASGSAQLSRHHTTSPSGSLIILDLSMRQSKNQTLDDLFHLCWTQQECSGCLHQGPCSWCAVVSPSQVAVTAQISIDATPQSSTCIPNPSNIHILAPIFRPNVCPLGSERWELRARSLGCHISTITFLTCIISIFSTLAVICLVAIGIRVFRTFQKWKTEHSNWWKVWRLYHPGWWRAWRFHSVCSREQQDSAEHRPLLGDT